MSAEENVRVMREIFSAIERRDAQRVLDLCDPNVEFHWPPSPPYGGITYGRDQEGPSWGKTWVPLQPTEAERRMDPRVVAASDDEVVVLWHQRGRSPTGESCDGEVLALYKLRDGKLIRRSDVLLRYRGDEHILGESPEPGEATQSQGRERLSLAQGRD